MLLGETELKYTTQISMDVGRTIVLSIIALIYAITVAVSFYLKIFGVLFFVTLPWSILATFMMAATIHTYSGNHLIWFLLGGILNLVLFLWFCLFKPMLKKMWEVSD
jgi:hypothetical protein